MLGYGQYHLAVVGGSDTELRSVKQRRSPYREVLLTVSNVGTQSHER